MAPRTRLTPADRRAQLVAVGARLFAVRAYDDVRMDEIAREAGVSRGLVYRYFPTKPELFAAVYEQAAVQLLDRTRLDQTRPFLEQVAEGLDAHFDYFEANRNTVLAANRTLAGDPVIQAIIGDELAELRRRMLDVTGLEGRPRDLASAAMMGWLVFVRAVCVEWLSTGAFGRDELRAVCVGALRGALDTAVGRDG